MPKRKKTVTYPEEPSCRIRLTDDAGGPFLIDQLEQYRLENKVSQQGIAAKLGISFSTVNRWLNRKSQPNKIQSYHIEKLIKKGLK